LRRGLVEQKIHHKVLKQKLSFSLHFGVMKHTGKRMKLGGDCCFFYNYDICARFRFRCDQRPAETKPCIFESKDKQTFLFINFNFIKTMKKFLLLLFTLLVSGGGNLWASKLYADLSKLTTDQATWDGATNTITWTATSNNMISNFDFAAGDYSSYSSASITVSNLTNAVGIRLQIKANGQEKLVVLNGEGTFTKNLIDDFGFTAADLANVEWIRVLGSAWQNNETNTIDADHPASAVISNVYLEGPTTLNFDSYGKAVISKYDLSATGGLSYEASTGVLTSDGTAGTLELTFETPVDLKNVFHFNVTRSGSDDIVNRLLFYDEDGTLINTWNSIKWSNTWNASGIDNNATNAFLNHKPVKKLVWQSDADAAKASLTLTISSVEFKLKTITCAKAGETVINTLEYKTMAGESASPSWNINTSTSLYYGSNTGDAAVSYADVTEYSEIRIYRNADTQFRAFFINAAGSNVNTIDGNNSASTWVSSGNYWSIDLSKVEKYNGMVALQGIKSQSYNINDIVKNIVVYQTPAANVPQYTLTGSGMQLAETVAALADENATCIDATGVTGITTNSEAGRTLLTSANPNCLFLGQTGDGYLANTQNVINSTTCANLVLTDGYPFKAPADFTATSATYTTTINSDAKAGTLCLPFAAAIPAEVTAYTLAYTSGDAATATPVETTIAANTPVLLNGSGEKTFSGSSVEIDADAANTSGALTGVFAATTVPTDSYVLQNGDDGVGFYKVNSDNITAQPFRAYLTAQSGDAKLRIIYPEDITAIEGIAASEEDVEGAWFTISGVRLEGKPTAKGIYINRGKKFIVK